MGSFLVCVAPDLTELIYTCRIHISRPRNKGPRAPPHGTLTVQAYPVLRLLRPDTKHATEGPVLTDEDQNVTKTGSRKKESCMLSKLLALWWAM